MFFVNSIFKGSKHRTAKVALAHRKEKHYVGVRENQAVLCMMPFIIKNKSNRKRVSLFSTILSGTSLLIQNGFHEAIDFIKYHESTMLHLFGLGVFSGGELRNYLYQ